MIKPKDMRPEAVAQRVAAVRELVKLEDAMGLWDEEIIPSDLDPANVLDELEGNK